MISLKKRVRSTIWVQPHIHKITMMKWSVNVAFSELPANNIYEIERSEYAWPLERIIGWSSNIYLLVLTKTKLALNEKTQCNLQHSASCLRLIADTPRSHSTMSAHVSTYLLMQNSTIHDTCHLSSIQLVHPDPDFPTGKYEDNVKSKSWHSAVSCKQSTNAHGCSHTNRNIFQLSVSQTFAIQFSLGF